MICVESGSSEVIESNFKAIVYVHVCDNPYNIMKEAFSAIRVHLNTFRLLEEKKIPSIVDKFGWCTWDAFYLSVEPKGVFHGVDEFSQGGFPIRFLIIDDGWQSVICDEDNIHEDKNKSLVLGGEQMTLRLYRFDEGEKFRKYKGGMLLGSNPLPYNPMKPKLIISKAIEIEHAEKERMRADIDLSALEEKILMLKQELDELMGGDDQSEGDTSDQSCEVEEYGMKAFTKDLRKKFKGLDDIWVWHALCGAWGGVRPETTHLNASVIPCKLSPGLAGTMDDLAVEKIVEGGIGLVHPDQASDLYDSMHSYLSSVGITGVKVDVIQVSIYTFNLKFLLFSY